MTLQVDSPTAKHRPWLPGLMLLAMVLFAVTVSHTGHAQDEEDDDGEMTPMRVAPPAKPGGDQATFTGSLQIVRAPSAATPGTGKFKMEIFPEASKVAMSVREVNPIPIESARRGGPWLCAKANCSSQPGALGASEVGDAMLRSIKVQTPAMPLPVSIWRRKGRGAKLDFDPVLLSRRSYNHVCAYGPIVSDDPNAKPKDPALVDTCTDGEAPTPKPDSAELLLGFSWPREAELADFKYLAIVDACGNARVQTFQRTFTIPAVHVPNGSCNSKPDGRSLRVFPTGGFVRVTAFNLDAPASGDVMNVTYRVSIPALENYSETEPAKLLFPDINLNDLKIDCSPQLRRNPTHRSGIPMGPDGRPVGLGSAPEWHPAIPKPEPTKKLVPPVPGEEPPLDDTTPTTPPAPPPTPTPPEPSGELTPPMPIGAAISLLAAPGDNSPSKLGVTAGSAGPPAGPAPTGTVGAGNQTAPVVEAKTTGPRAQPLDHGSLVIAPEPLREGNCRLTLMGITKQRLATAPLALHVALYRTDKGGTTDSEGNPTNLIPTDQATWIVSPSDDTFPIPPLRNGFDGESRLKLVVKSDPLNPNGKVVLIADAGKVAAVLNNDAGGQDELARRTIGSVTIHTVPLCGESNFETLEETGSCVRAYLTIPAMLATIQITRAPWLEKPLITRSVLSAVGVALAFDSYDPVERSAFPVAGQVGGFVQDLGEDRIGLMAYTGVAPTLPILGDGGNTTSFGFLAGVGITYITNTDGPDEGFKPTAFLSVVVQVGQANPETAGASTFGQYGK